MSSRASSSRILPAVRASLAKCCQRRSLRLLSVCFVLFLVIVFHLTRDTLPRHHAPYEAPVTKLAVHGNIVDGLPEPSYDLNPFPYSPRQTPTDDEGDNPWLAAVISTASDVERRMLIRSTWMRLYKEIPFDGRFVISNPGPQWTEVVARENSTFGDMIVLDHISEDDITANTIKTLEFFKWLGVHSRKYEFVSKMDTDLWLNARGFWDRFLFPRLLQNDTGTFTATVERTVIGELYYSKYWDLTFPHGAMYTVTWDMVELLSSLQERFNVVTGEDMAVATLMLKGRERANFVNFRGSEKFDYNDEDARDDGSAWAREKTHPNAIDHAVAGPNPIAVHQLKDEKFWFKTDEKNPKQAFFITLLQKWLRPSFSSQAQTAVKELQDSYGVDHLDIVIANAGVSYAWPAVADLKISDLKGHIEPNVYGVISLFQATRPLLKKASREPIFAPMGSTAGCVENQPPITNAAYGPSKAAVNWFGVRINAEEDWLHAFVLGPGWVQTDLGNAGAQHFGLEEASTTVDESCDGMMKLLATTTKEKHGGKMVTFEGKIDGY